MGALRGQLIPDCWKEQQLYTKSTEGGGQTSFMWNWNRIRNPENFLWLSSQSTHFRTSARKTMTAFLVRVRSKPTTQNWIFFSGKQTQTSLVCLCTILVSVKQRNFLLRGLCCREVQLCLPLSMCVFFKADSSDCDKKRRWPKPVCSILAVFGPGEILRPLTVKMLRRRPSNASEKEQAQKKKVRWHFEELECSERFKNNIFSARSSVDMTNCECVELFCWIPEVTDVSAVTLKADV